jgi:hypothetical protein
VSDITEAELTILIHARDRVAAMSEWAIDPSIYCFDVPPPPPPAEKPPDDDWTVRDVPHEMADSISANKDAWTDYRDRGRVLRHDKVDDRSTRVRTREPLFRFDEVKVTKVGDRWEARRA